MKQAAVRIAGSTREPQNITIHPGSEVYYGDDENVYEQVSDGALLYATTPAEVGVK
jgi:hypothetical protein